MPLVVPAHYRPCPYSFMFLIDHVLITGAITIGTCSFQTIPLVETYFIQRKWIGHGHTNATMPSPETIALSVHVHYRPYPY